MGSTIGNEWNLTVDDACRNRLLTSAQAAYENACTLVVDAKVLRNVERFHRAGALAILAEEEFAKGFMLAICANIRRWDSAVFHDMNNHGAKQAVSQGVLAYMQWLKERFGDESGEIVLPIEPRHALIPDSVEFDKMVNHARTMNIKKRTRDKLKQRLLYIGVGREACVVHRPSAIPVAVADECIQTACEFKFAVEAVIAGQVVNFKTIAV